MMAVSKIAQIAEVNAIPVPAHNPPAEAVLVWDGEVPGAWSSRCGARQTQFAMEGIEFPDGLLLADDECLEEIRFCGHQ